MPTGLAALAATYGLEYAELRQLKLLSERFFDQLREELARSVGRSVRMLDLSQRVETFANFCSGPRAQHLAILGFDEEAAIAVRLDRALAAAMVASVLGTALEPSVDSQRAATSVEQYILSNALGAALVKIVPQVLSVFFGRRTGLRLTQMEHRPGLPPGTLAPSEHMVTAAVNCMVGVSGGWIEIGMPVSMILQIHTRLVPARVKHSDPVTELHKARTLLPNVAIELEAVLGRVSVPLAEVRALQPGSVLLLQKARCGVPCVELHCGGHPLFCGTVVEHRGWHRLIINQKGRAEHGSCREDCDV